MGRCAKTPPNLNAIRATDAAVQGATTPHFKPSFSPMSPLFARQAAWSALAAAAPYTLYLFATRQLRVPRFQLTLSDDDLLDDLFEGEVAASTP